MSLITVRRALEELERAGKVRRHQGLGTFLARPRIVTEPALTGSLLESLGPGASNPVTTSLATKVLAIRRGLPPADIAQALRIPAGGHVWQLRRPAAERRFLAIAPHAYAVRIRGLSADRSGTPFDCFEQLYPASEFAFAISGTTSRRLFPAPDFQNWEISPAGNEAADAPISGR